MADDTINKASEAIGERLRVAADTMKASTEKLAETGSQLSVRLLDQAEVNTREAFAAMRAVAQARDVAEMMRVQSDFFRDQGTRSMEQARELGEMVIGMGRDTVGQLTRSR